MISFSVGVWVKIAEFDFFFKSKHHEECCGGFLNRVETMFLTSPLRSFPNGATGEEFVTPIFSLFVVKWDTSDDIGICYSR